jgi:hypothetical protein
MQRRRSLSLLLVHPPQQEQLQQRNHRYKHNQ